MLLCHLYFHLTFTSLEPNLDGINDASYSLDGINGASYTRDGINGASYSLDDINSDINGTDTVNGASCSLYTDITCCIRCELYKSCIIQPGLYK